MESLEERRDRLTRRLDAIKHEQEYDVFRGNPDEPEKLEKAIARIKKRQRRRVDDTLKDSVRA